MIMSFVDPCPELCANVSPKFKDLCNAACERYSNCAITPSALYNALYYLSQNINPSEVVPVRGILEGALIRLLIFIFAPIALVLIITFYLTMKPVTASILTVVTLLLFVGATIWCLFEIRRYSDAQIDAASTNLSTALGANTENAAKAYIEAIIKSTTPC